MAAIPTKVDRSRRESNEAARIDGSATAPLAQRGNAAFPGMALMACQGQLGTRQELVPHLRATAQGQEHDASFQWQQ
jgi:hypothetical protein